jgi:hypothetical protein
MPLIRGRVKGRPLDLEGPPLGSKGKVSLARTEGKPLDMLGPLLGGKGKISTTVPLRKKARRTQPVSHPSCQSDLMGFFEEDEPD